MMPFWFVLEGLNFTGSRLFEASRSWRDRDGVEGRAKSRLSSSNCCLLSLDVDHMGIPESSLLSLSITDAVTLSLLEEVRGGKAFLWLLSCSVGSFGNGRLRSEIDLPRDLFIWSIGSLNNNRNTMGITMCLGAAPIVVDEQAMLLSQHSLHVPVASWMY